MVIYNFVMILSDFLSLLLTHLVKVCHLHNVDDHYERKKFSYVIEGCNALPLTTYDVERAIPDMLRECGISSSDINEFRHKIPESFLKYVNTFDLDLEMCYQNKTQLVRVGNYPLDGPSPLIPYNKNSRNLPIRRFIRFDPTRHIIYDNVPHSITVRHSFETIVTNRHLLQLLMLHDTTNDSYYSQLYQNGEKRSVHKSTYYNNNFGESIRLQIQQIVNDIVSDYMYIFCGGITRESSSIITDYLGAYVFLGSYYETHSFHERNDGECISRILYSSDVVLNDSENDSENDS
jgi:hypothetical protein